MTIKRQNSRIINHAGQLAPKLYRFEGSTSLDVLLKAIREDFPNVPNDRIELDPTYVKGAIEVRTH